VAGQVHAEERERWVGHRVDQRAHEVAALWAQAQVGAAEGHDARVGRGSRDDREAVRPGAGAEDRVARGDGAVSGVQNDLARAVLDPGDLAPESDAPAALPDLPG
jgi:hypothetical protein